MNKLAKDKLTVLSPVIFSLIPFCIGAIVSLLILPENCRLFGNPDGPFSCDSFPNDCCPDMTTVFVAQIIFWLGFVLTVAAYLIHRQKDVQDNSDTSLKLFD